MEDDLFNTHFERKDHPPMPSHDTSLAEASQTLTGEYSASLARTSNVLLGACGLASEASVNELDAVPVHRRGRPQQVCWTHLWSSLLLCTLQGMNSFADWRRLVGLQQIGPFAPVWLTRNGLVKRPTGCATSF